MSVRDERARRAAQWSLSRRKGRPVLTEREWELLTGWAEGKSTKTIADEAKAHRQTYYSAVTPLFAKLNSPRDRAAAMLHAIRLGLIDPEEYQPDEELEDEAG